MQNTQEAINPHLLLHTNADPEPPDDHNYFHIGQPQQHMLGQTPYLHYAPQSPPPPSLTASSQAHNVYGSGRESIEARYRALMRNMLMYQQMRIRAMNMTYTEPQTPQQETATLFSSFSLPQHHQNFEYSISASFTLPPPAESTIIEKTSAVSHVGIVTPALTNPPMQDRYQDQCQAESERQFGYNNNNDDDNDGNKTITTDPFQDSRQKQHQKPNRISQREVRPPKPAHSVTKPGNGRITTAARSSSRISRPNPKAKSRPVASAVQFALEELASSNRLQPTHRVGPAQERAQRSSPAADRGREGDGGQGRGGGGGDDDDDGQVGVDLDGMGFRGGGDSGNLVLECFVSSMSSGLG